MKTFSLALMLSCIYSLMFSQQNSSFEKAWFESTKTVKQPKYNTAMDNYDVKFYFLDLNVINTNKNINGSGSMLATVVANSINEIVVELHNTLTIDSLKVDNVIHTFTRSGTEVHIPLATALSAGQDFYLTVYYRGSSTGSGIKTAQSGSWGRWVTYTLSESYHSLDWFPCKQSLTDKIDSVWVFLTVNNNLKGGSNGVLTHIVPVGTTKSRYEWKTNYPIDYYLISLAVSDYQEYNIYAHPAGYSDSILIQNYIYPNTNYLPQYQASIDQTADFIEFLSDIWGLYPFHEEKYGHCTAPFSGGMEHQTMTSLGYFNFELVLHELAHQWFGDYVTCASWQDIWVNEGFATYSVYLGHESINTYADAQTYMADMHDDIMSAPDGSIYIPFAEVNDESRIFDYRLTYEKGAAILHSLRFYVNNDSVYFAAFRDFLQMYGFSTAYADDFRDVMEAHTGLNLDAFFNEWLYGEGFPTYSIEATPYNDTLYCTLIQTASMPTVTPFFTNPLELKIIHNNGDTLVRVQPDYSVYSFEIPMPHTVSSIVIDPANDIVNESGSVLIGIPHHPAVSATVYPNPVKDRLYFSSEHRFDQYVISDITGKIIAAGLVTGNSVPMGLPTQGIYQLSLSGNDGTYHTRFVYMP